MVKCKQVLMGLGVIVITSVAWLVSSFSKPETSTVTDDSSVFENDMQVQGLVVTTDPAVSRNTPQTATISAVNDLLEQAKKSNKTSTYDVDVSSFRLVVNGMVNKSLSLTYKQIQQYPAVNEIAQIVCPGTVNETDDWTGVPVSTLLREAGLSPDANEVVFEGADGYSVKLPLESVLHDGVFLAYNMHGQQLSKEQGYPLRLVIAGSGGGDWMRWVTNIRLNPASVIMANRPLVIQGEDATQPSARKMFCSGLCKIH